jgi:ADP-heptose:LPS heptosyltransferase
VRKKIVLIRLDKIGDLICTLPVDQVIDANEFDITWIVQKGMGAVVDLEAQKRKYFELDKSDSKNSAQKISEILAELKPDVAISFQAPWWVNFELFKARVPIRAGVQSQWHSFLFLTKGLRQKRSLSAQHELQYNLDLVLNTLNLKNTHPYLNFTIAKPAETNTLQKNNLEPQKYIVVHPGMMGSALNWKQSQYISFINTELLKMKKVVITGTESDEIYLTEIKKEFSNNLNVINLQSKLNLKELIQVLANAEFVVAPSTGVAHLAASTGVAVKAIYSPIRVHHPRRWATRGPNVKINLPHVECPASDQCFKEKCSHYNCMDLVSV